MDSRRSCRSRVFSLPASWGGPGETRAPRPALAGRGLGAQAAPPPGGEDAAQRPRPPPAEVATRWRGRCRGSRTLPHLPAPPPGWAGPSHTIPPGQTIVWAQPRGAGRRGGCRGAPRGRGRGRPEPGYREGRPRGAAAPRPERPGGGVRTGGWGGRGPLPLASATVELSVSMVYRMPS